MEYLPALGEKWLHSRGNGWVNIPVPWSIWDTLSMQKFVRFQAPHSLAVIGFAVEGSLLTNGSHHNSLRISCDLCM